jgi:hypothetical protein
MRAILNAILSFIGAESLTDEEYEYCETNIDDSDEPEQVYAALFTVLEERDSVSDMSGRLRYYYLAKGISVATDAEELENGAKTNIFVGDVLE